MTEQELTDIVEKAGGIYVGIQELTRDLLLYTDPDTETSIAYYIDELQHLSEEQQVEVLKEHLLERRKIFNESMARLQD